MGLLDDAIREHLELKRRRGADQSEVESQEQAALGPVVRGELEAVGSVEPAPAAPEPAADEPAPVAEEPEPADEPAPVAEEPLGATMEFDSLVPAAEGNEGVLLEETPEFLAETPDHDRLWFEQKPPKDFDF